MRLRNAQKLGAGICRVVSTEATLDHVRELFPRIGITRLADITGLDRIGIPTYSVSVPRSQDILSVYNGKGVRPIDARVGAIMEAIERFSAWSPRDPRMVASYTDIKPSHNVLNPRDVNLETAEGYTDDTKIAWIEGFDLLRGEDVLVPLDLAGYFVNQLPDTHGRPCFAIATSNGLAAGSTLEEAVCQALCEVIERDAWTLAELLSHWLPKAIACTKSRIKPLACALSQDDLEQCPSVDLGSVRGVPRGLIDLFERAGLEPIVRNITSDARVPVFHCTVHEDVTLGYSRVHGGLGCHPDVTVALTRALTEAAQSRAVDIQGVREDIALPRQPPTLAHHVRRVDLVNPRSWLSAHSRQPIRIDELPSQSNGDILDDISYLLSCLSEAGLERVIVIDLTLSVLGIHVVRVIVPGLESWIVDRCTIGERATAAWREKARQAHARGLRS
jgi:ribosomal protein S12 methylthiotransferase accessory factor